MGTEIKNFNNKPASQLKNKIMSNQNNNNDQIFPVKTQTPGTLISIRAKVGEKIEKGSILAELQSMKMKTSIVTPVPGTVISINTKIGEKISKGEILAEVESMKMRSSITY